MDSEQDKMTKTAHNKIFIAPPMQIDLAEFYTELQNLLKTIRQSTTTTTWSTACSEMVPTYHPNRVVRADHTVKRCHRQH